MPRIGHAQVSASLPPTVHRALRIRLAVDGASFQSWLERQVRRYIESTPEGAPARKPTKRSATREGDRP